MLPLARNAVGTLIGGIVFGTVLFGHAYAAPKPAAKETCFEMKKGLEILSYVAKQHGYGIGAVSPENMPKFIAAMKDHAVTIKGEAAVAMYSKTGELAVFAKQGEKLCLVYDGKNVLLDGADAAAPAPAAPKPTVEGAEWL